MKFLTNIDLAKNQLLNVVIHGSGTPPSSPVEGQLYFDTTVADKKMYFWDGTAWIAASGASADISAAVADADYTASSILYATSSSPGVPVPLTVGTNSVVGRVAGEIQTLAIDSDLSSTSASHDTLPSALAVKNYADGLIGANNAMVYKGTVGSGGTHTIAAFNSLATYSIGWTYKVIEAGTIKGQVCQIGDVVIAVVARAGSGQVDADWTVVQNNVDGAVTGPASVTVDGNIALFNGTTGKIIKDSTVALSTLSPVAGSSSITTVGTIGAGTWQGTLIGPTYGGTGVNNGSRTLTIAANSGTISYTSAATTLTVAATASVSGTNTGDQTTVSGNAGTATLLQTARNIYGNSFTGGADLTQIISSVYGGTGNGWTKFTGATTSEKTYTLPNQNATLLYDGGGLGTPSSGVATNLTGTASGLTAGTCTTIPNLTGNVTSVGNTTTIPASTVTLAMQANLAANSIMGNNTGGTIAPKALTATEVRTLINVADGATANTGTVTKYSVTFGDNAATSFVITHNLNTRDVIYKVYEAGTPWAEVMCDCVLTSTTEITLSFATAPASNQYRVVVMA